MVILDIPLLIENNLNEKDDILIFVSAKKSKVLRRLKKRPNFSLKVLKNLKEKQLFLSKKRKFAKYIIDNNFPPNIMKSKINLLKKKILYEKVVLDTETTGLSVRDGHRIVEIGCIDYDNLIPTKRLFIAILTQRKSIRKCV